MWLLVMRLTFGVSAQKNSTVLAAIELDDKKNKASADAGLRLPDRLCRRLHLQSWLPEFVLDVKATNIFT